MYKKKASPVEAIQFTGSFTDDLRSFLTSKDVATIEDGKLVIRYGPYRQVFEVGDWLVRGEDVFIDLYTNERFRRKFELVP